VVLPGVKRYFRGVFKPEAIAALLVSNADVQVLAKRAVFLFSVWGC
jgi:hypothetical protein